MRAPCLVQYGSELYPQPPLVTSAPQAWPGLRVERHQPPATELPAHYHQHHLLVLHQPAAPVAVRRQRGQAVEKTIFQAGDLSLHPAGEYGAVAWDRPTDIIHLHLDGPYLTNLAGPSLSRTFTLGDQFRFRDPLLTQLGRQLLGAVSAPPALGPRYVESLIQTLGYHLLEHYATPERRATSPPRLPAPVLARLDAYVEAHADAPIPLATLAGLANLSVFQFARRFKLTTGVPPHQYVLGWKIRRAQQLLRAGGLPLAAVSDALGFASPAYFGAVFKRVVGLSPAEYLARRGR